MRFFRKKKTTTTTTETKMAQERAERLLAGQTDLTDVSDNLRDITQQARGIADTYANLAGTALTLAQRDQDGDSDRLADLKERTEVAEHERDKLKAEVEAAEVDVEVLIGMVRPGVKFALNFPHQFSNEVARNLRQFMRDFPEDGEMNFSVVRMTNEKYHKLTGDLDLAKRKLLELMNVCKEQNEIIEERNKTVEYGLRKMQVYANVFQSKDHEILLLKNEVKKVADEAEEVNEKLTQEVEEVKESLRLAQSDLADSAEAYRRLQLEANENDEKLDEKDRQIFKIHVEYDSLKEQLTMYKNKITRLEEQYHGHAKLPEGNHIKTSASTFQLRVQNLNSGVIGGGGRPQQTFRFITAPSNTVGPQQAQIASGQDSDVAQSVPSYRIDHQGRTRRLSDPFNLAPAFWSPPSGHGVPEMPKLPAGTMQDCNKPLPSPPIQSRGVASDTSSAESYGRAVAYPGPTSYTIRAPPTTPMTQHRVLANITEASRETAESTPTRSATNTDREAVRLSIHAFDELTSQRGQVPEISPSQNETLVQTRRRLRKVASHDMDVKELYHHGRRGQF